MGSRQRKCFMNIDEPCSGATSWQSRGQCHLVTSKSNESVKRREGKESDTPLRKRISTDSNNVPVLPVTKHNLSSSWRSMLSARRCHSSALLFLFDPRQSLLCLQVCLQHPRNLREPLSDFVSSCPAAARGSSQAPTTRPRLSVCV